MGTHRLIGHKVQCTDRPNENGIIIFYNPDNGDMNIDYQGFIFRTHISKCKVITI